MIKEIKAASMNAQTSAYHQANAFTLWGELGFLFHMMNLIATEKSDIPRVVSANNFQLSLRQIPEALALGLIETASAAQQQLDPQLTVQAFMKFLLLQLQRECEKESQFDPFAPSLAKKSNDNLTSLAVKPEKSTSPSVTSSTAVEDIFAYSTIVNTTFLQSNTVENGTPFKSTTLEIIYPSTAPASRNSKPADMKKKNLTSFSAILITSFMKETFMRGWCEASKSYEPFKQSRTIFSMAKVKYRHIYLYTHEYTHIYVYTYKHTHTYMQASKISV